ncbi:MAG: hypothetical protein ISQ75_07005 [Puniceicoccaceae bacterium]|nr:hypothetical protein [Puniceicoccaceae bacterium]
MAPQTGGDEVHGEVDWYLILLGSQLEVDTGMAYQKIIEERIGLLGLA